MEMENSSQNSSNGDGISGSDKLLFGGSLQCFLPGGAIDVSAIREVPDHQEVFCHKTTDQSIMIDILQFQAEQHGEQAPRYHFNDIAEANSSEGKNEVNNIESIPRNLIAMQECQEAWFLEGTQLVSKYNEEASAQNTIKIYLGLFRLPQFGTDLVVTMNDPVNISASSSSSKITSTTVTAENSNPWTVLSFRNLLCTLKILDSSLFC